MNIYSNKESEMLSECRLCPQNCGADRLSGGTGYCKTDAGFNISSICVHKGEEPVISGNKGICNIFFSHCNLQCVYCQNDSISSNKKKISGKYLTFNEILFEICQKLEQTENIIGFVSPSHNIPQVIAIIRGLHKLKRDPVFVYNSNGYDNPKSLRLVADYIDVYLPDFKYIDATIGYKYSGVKNYPDIAMSSIREMYIQKGATLLVDEKGIVESGLIIRHLILPGKVQNTIDILKYIAEEISPDIHISLMSQYFPTPRMKEDPLMNRPISEEEYNIVLNALAKYGFYRGWTQEMGSNSFYQPDFSRDEPFCL